MADALVARHANEPATVFLSVAARRTGAAPRAVERALSEDLSLARMLCVRRAAFAGAESPGAGGGGVHPLEPSRPANAPP
ncbi:hypothetical protein GCM10023082_59260 [Streptomyces tremellae]|uniref:Uncharacterized protein n=1 Tax=Streptomyces tremellae TaxID=1124239 RepID=A0ABP7G4Q3_9ACTN